MAVGEKQAVQNWLLRLNRKRFCNLKHLERYFVNTYITLREGYNYPSLQYDYETVQLYSSNTVKDDYLRLYNSDMAPDKIYHNNGSYVAIEVISNIISDATAPDKLASVRFKNDETSRPDRFQFHTGRLVWHIVLNQKSRLKVPVVSLILSVLL